MNRSFEITQRLLTAWLHSVRNVRFFDIERAFTECSLMNYRATLRSRVTTARYAAVPILEEQGRERGSGLLTTTTDVAPIMLRARSVDEGYSAATATLPSGSFKTRPRFSKQQLII